MVHLIIITFIQYGLIIEAVESKVSPLPFTRAVCEEMRQAASSTELPLKEGADAHWQIGTCVPLQSISEPQPITEPWTY